MQLEATWAGYGSIGVKYHCCHLPSQIDETLVVFLTLFGMKHCLVTGVQPSLPSQH